MSSTYLHNVAKFGQIAAEIGSGVWGTPANFNGFRVLPSLLQRRRSPEANQTSHDVWPSAGLLQYNYIHFRGLLCLLTEFCPVQNSLYAQVLRSHIGAYWQCYYTALQQRASAKLRRRKLISKERNYRTFAEGTSYIRQGGHYVGHRPTF